MLRKSSLVKGDPTLDLLSNFYGVYQHGTKLYHERAIWSQSVSVAVYDLSHEQAEHEDDEGWGIFVGRDFGCIHFKAK